MLAINGLLDGKVPVPETMTVITAGFAAIALSGKLVFQIHNAVPNATSMPSNWH